MDPLLRSEINSLEPLRMFLPAEVITDADLQSLKAILKEYPGPAPVMIRLATKPWDGSGPHKDLLLGEAFNVDGLDRTLAERLIGALFTIWRKAKNAPSS